MMKALALFVVYVQWIFNTFADCPIKAFHRLCSVEVVGFTLSFTYVNTKLRNSRDNGSVYR